MVLAYITKDEELDDFILNLEFTDKYSRGREISIEYLPAIFQTSKAWIFDKQRNMLSSYMNDNMVNVYKSINN